MARNGRKAGERPLRRRVATRQPRKTLLVFCEGERTEPEYLDALKRQRSIRDVAAVDLRIETGDGGSVPKTLVSMAIDARRRVIDEEGEIDEFWCIFDVEWPTNHPGLKDAIEQARQCGIEVAISNPCFELWLILHFQDQTAWLENRDARMLRHRLDRSRDKSLNAALYMPLFEAAARRAAQLDNLHEQHGTVFPQNNPSSGMHRLIAAITPPDSSGG